MGLLSKIKELENEKKDDDLSRYFIFKSLFKSFLEDVGAKKGAFLVKHGKFFHLAFPVNIEAKVFTKYTLDASLILSIDNTPYEPFLLFNEGDSLEMELLGTSILYELDNLGCVFLLLSFENRLDVLQKNKKTLLSKIEDFKKEYEQNEILINTSTPPFPKYIGTSSIESKMQGSVLASTKPNFLEFRFTSMFDLSSLHQDTDDLALFYSIVNRINKMIGKPNFAILESNLILNACIFSSLPLDEVVYGTTLKTILSSMYGKDLITKLEIVFVKTLHDSHEKISSWINENYNPLEAL